MSEQLDIFGHQPAAKYPTSPGWKSAGSSKEAAAHVKPKAANLREGVLACLALGPMTAEEICARLNIDILAGRPRLTECLKLHLVEKTDERRRSRSGLSSTVWRLVKS